jgi:hypothetical protein
MIHAVLPQDSGLRLIGRVPLGENCGFRFRVEFQAEFVGLDHHPPEGDF